MLISPEGEQLLLAHPFFQYAVAQGASDIHLVAGLPPMAQVNGQLERYDGPRNTDDAIAVLLRVLCPRQLCSAFMGGEENELDFTCQMPSSGRRFRVNAFRQHHGLSLVLRVLLERVRTFDELGLPKAFERLAFERSGFILVTGSSGSGKSTTLASLIAAINHKQRRHVITIEDPIEVIFESKMALVEQREVGTHTATFHAALRSAIREAAHVILVGEIRDSATAQMALQAAQMGVLVLATLHTRSAAETISRYISMFEDAWRVSARQQIADVLLGVLCQTLVPRRNGQGRVAACEVLIGTTATRHLIRDDRSHLLHSAMEIASTDGMITLEQALINLHRQGAIDLKVAFENAVDKAAFLAQVPPELQGELQIPWETELEIKNLEKLRDAQVRRASSRQFH